MPFKVFFNPDVQHLAIRRQGRTAESGNQTGDVAGLNNDLLVDVVRVYSKQPGAEIPVIAVISDAQKHRRPWEIRNKSLNDRVRRLGDDEVEALLLAYKAGDSTYMLARRFDIHRHTVADHLRRRGIPLRRTTPSN